MAELYLQQGFRDEALQVYRQLAALNPDDESIKDRIRHLESGDRASLSFAAVTDEAVPAEPAAPEAAAPAGDLERPAGLAARRAPDTVVVVLAGSE